MSAGAIRHDRPGCGYVISNYDPHVGCNRPYVETIIGRMRGRELVRRIDRISRLVATLWVASVLAGCSTLLGPSPAQLPNLGISNETTLTVTLAVNGAVIATFAPGTASSAISAPLPELPWIVEARSPSGRVLTSLTVHAGDVTSTEGPDGKSSSRSDGARVDLSCGRLDIWAGMPMNGPMPGPGTPGDCGP